MAIIVAKLCSIANCPKPSRSRSWCVAHYARWRKYGDPEHSKYALSVGERFEKFTEYVEGCQVWVGTINSSGYGWMSYGGKPKAVHRVMWEHCENTLVPGMEIDHICRNRACVRIDHLRQITNKENKENHSGPRSDSSTGIRGVIYRKRDKCFATEVQHKHKKYSKQGFSAAQDAENYVVLLRSVLHTYNDLDRN